MSKWNLSVSPFLYLSIPYLCFKYIKTIKVNNSYFVKYNIDKHTLNKTDKFVYDSMFSE